MYYHKTVEIMVFLIFCLLMEGSGFVLFITDPAAPQKNTLGIRIINFKK
jgi:hypothetical protein